MTTNNATGSAVLTSATSTVMSDELFERLTECVKDLHHLTSLMPADSKVGEIPTEFPKLGTDEWEKVMVKALNATRRYKKAKKEEQVRQFRAGCEKVVAEARGVQMKAKEEYDALSPSLKAIMPKFPTNVDIAVSDFSDIFPEGTTSERMVVLLKDLGYKIAKTAGGACVQVSLIPETKEEKDARVGVVRRPAA